MATIYGQSIVIGGNSIGSSSLFNFPITISNTEPTPTVNGHIWINTTRGNNVSSVYIVDKPTSDIPNNSLIFEVYDTKNSSIELTQSISVGSSTIPMSYSAEAKGNHPWLVNANSSNTTYLAYPRVFIKTNNTLYIETAYVWNGSYWMLLSQADTYLFSLVNENSSYESSYSTATSPINVYNITDGTYTKHDDIAPASTKRVRNFSVSDANGAYVAYMDTDETIYVYKRVGDTFSEYFKVTKNDFVNYLPETYKNYFYCYPSNNNYGHSILLSATGDYLTITYLYHTAEENTATGNVKSGILLLKNNGSTFVYHNNQDIHSMYCNGGSSSVNSSYVYMQASDDFSVIVVSSTLYEFYTYTSTNHHYGITYLLTGSPDSYNVTQIFNQGTNNNMPKFALSKDGSVLVHEVASYDSYDDEYDFYYYVYSVDKNSSSISNLGNMYYRSYYRTVETIHISPDNHIWLAYSHNGTIGEVMYLQQGKVENGVFTKLVDGFAIDNGNGEYLYDAYDEDTSGSSLVYYDMCVDVKNNLLYLSSKRGIYVCDMTRTNTGALDSYTQKAIIGNDSNYFVHNKIAITPNVSM